MDQKERRGKIDELKHLLKYHRQATHEFFDDAEHNVLENADILLRCLDKDEKNISEIKRMTSCLETAQKDLRNRLGDLDYLISRMVELINSLSSSGK
ncbi:MAG: hypothetical protein PHE61_07200 [Candidatus Omnitrophica bacterium]|nr:hypothetical protein [Candidatus Omnitrophota bacterium]